MITTNENFPESLCFKHEKRDDAWVVHIPIYDIHLQVTSSFKTAAKITKCKNLKGLESVGHFRAFDDAPPVLVLTRNNLNIIAHECYHFVRWVADQFGLECEESKAYLMGFCMDAVSHCVSAMNYEDEV